MNPDRTVSDVRVWPSLSRAARFLGVDKATLSRRPDLEHQRVGRQELRLSPASVIRLAREYRRRVVDEVAFDLVEYARTRLPEQVAVVEGEIDDALASVSAPAGQPDITTFLAMAEALLPADLYAMVRTAVFGRGAAASHGVLGDAQSTVVEPGPKPARPEPGGPSPTTGPKVAVRA